MLSGAESVAVKKYSLFDLPMLWCESAIDALRHARAHCGFAAVRCTNVAAAHALTDQMIRSLSESAIDVTVIVRSEHRRQQLARAYPRISCAIVANDGSVRGVDGAIIICEGLASNRMLYYVLPVLQMADVAVLASVPAFDEIAHRNNDVVAEINGLERSMRVALNQKT